MKESVIDMLLNFKSLRFSIDESVETEQRVSHTFKGVGKFSAKDIVFPAGVSVLNSDQHIFEVSDSSLSLSVDMRVEKGYGYYSMDYLSSREAKKDDSDANILLVDNDFRIAEYVTYSVEQVIDDFK